MEKLSVIIPAYQAGKYLAEAVSSVRMQKWVGKSEIIIVDDGSTDDTQETARKLGDIVLAQPHGGAAGARNEGIRASSGNWIMMLDADDVLASDALERLYAPFKTNPELMAAFGQAQDFISPELSEEQRSILSCRRGSYAGILPGCALLRREVFERVGLFEETLKSGETVAWQIKLRESGIPTVQIQAVTLYRRIHLTNTGLIDRKREMQNYAAILRERMQKR